MTISFNRTIPILRMFSVEKAKEFYVGYLGFQLDWEHKFPEVAPIYMQVSRAGLILHLSEHYGDGSPGIEYLRADGRNRGVSPRAERQKLRLFSGRTAAHALEHHFTQRNRSVWKQTQIQ